jgi:hypothetical protein
VAAHKGKGFVAGQSSAWVVTHMLIVEAYARAGPEAVQLLQVCLSYPG